MKRRPVYKFVALWSYSVPEKNKVLPVRALDHGDDTSGQTGSCAPAHPADLRGTVVGHETRRWLGHDGAGCGGGRPRSRGRGRPDWGGSAGGPDWSMGTGGPDWDGDDGGDADRAGGPDAGRPDWGSRGAGPAGRHRRGGRAVPAGRHRGSDRAGPAGRHRGSDRAGPAGGVGSGDRGRARPRLSGAGPALGAGTVVGRGRSPAIEMVVRIKRFIEPYYTIQLTQGRRTRRQRQQEGSLRRSSFLMIVVVLMLG
nr:hypothetical protein CFP56_31535 [Quercus suber]